MKGRFLTASLAVVLVTGVACGHSSAGGAVLASAAFGQVRSDPAPATGSEAPSTSTSQTPIRYAQTKPGALLFKNSDFERGNLSHWEATGEAFAQQPTKWDNPTARGSDMPARHQGHYWIGTFEEYAGTAGQRPGATQGDEPQGTLTSEPFTIMEHRIAFYCGGGRLMSMAYVALLVDGEEVLKATGKQSDSMHEVVWDVSNYAGKKARIVIRDASSDEWGHISADYFRYVSPQTEPRGGVVTRPVPETRPETPGQRPDAATEIEHGVAPQH